MKFKHPSIKSLYLLVFTAVSACRVGGDPINDAEISADKITADFVLVSVSDSSYDFGYVNTSSSSTKTFTVSNSAASKVSLTFLNSSSPFTMSNGCDSKLDPNSSCVISVTFASGVAGSYSSSFNVTAKMKSEDGMSAASKGLKVNLVGAAVDSPVVANDALSTNEDTAITFGANVTANDSVTSGFTLSLTFVSGALNGTISGLTYTPDQNWNGTEILTYVVTDSNAATANGTITLTVTAVNDDPTLTSEAFTAPYGAVNNLLALTSSDTEGDTVTFTAINCDSGGSATIESATSGIVRYSPAAAVSAVETCTATLADNGIPNASVNRTFNVTITEASKNSERATLVNPVAANEFARDPSTGALYVGGTSGTSGYVAKYSSAGGAPVWSHTFGGSGTEYVVGLAVTTDGGVVIMGRHLNNGAAFAISNCAAIHQTPSATRVNTFLVRLNSDGTCVWARDYGTDIQVYGKEMAIDTYTDDVFLAGMYANGNITFGGDTLPAVNTFTSFITKINSAGTAQWARALYDAHTNWDDPRAVSVRTMDPGGAGEEQVVYFANYGYSNITSTSTTGTDNGVVFTVGATWHAQVIRYDGTTGSRIWADNYLTSYAEPIMTIDSAGNLHAVLRYSDDSVTYNDTIITDTTRIDGVLQTAGTDITLTNSQAGSATADAILIKLRYADGKVLWLRNIQGGSANHEQFPGGLNVDDSDNVYLSGEFASTNLTTYGGPTIANSTAAGVKYEGILIKYDSDGNFVWITNAGADGVDSIFHKQAVTTTSASVFTIYQSNTTYSLFEITQ